MWPNFGYSSIFMGEVIITQILYGFDQKNQFFVEWCWFNNMRLVLGKPLKFYSIVAKGLKLKVKKCWGKLVRGLFAPPLSSHPE